MPVEVLESQCLENARKALSLFVPVFAGKSLDGWSASEKREKQILKASKTKKKNLDSLQAGGGKLW